MQAHETNAVASFNPMGNILFLVIFLVAGPICSNAKQVGSKLPLLVREAF